MRSGSLLKQRLPETGFVEIWEIQSIELGATNEVGAIRLHSLSRRNTVDNKPIEFAVPSNMISQMASVGLLEVYEKEPPCTIK